MFKVFLLSMLAVSLSFAKPYDRQKSVTDHEALIKKIIGIMPFRSSGWAFKDLSPENMVINIDLKDYPQKIVKSSYNQLFNDGYPVSYKNGVLTFNWKKLYCENYDTDIRKTYLSLNEFIASQTRSEAFEILYDDNCFIGNLSSQQRKELLGKKYFDHGSYFIGGSWTSLEHQFEKGYISFKKMEVIGNDIKKIAEKYCQASFKTTASRIIASILPLKEEHLNLKPQAYPEISFSHEKICSK